MLKKLVSLAAALLIALPVDGSVAFVRTATPLGGTNSSSFSISFNGTGCDLILVGVSQWKASDTAPTATFDTTQNFTNHTSQTLTDGSGVRRVTIFRLVAPHQTTANVVVSWSAAVDEAVVGIDCWSGVDQTTPLGTAVKATSSGGATTLSVNVTAASGAFTHDVYSRSADSTLGSTTNQTQRWREWATVATTEGGGASAAGTGSAVTHTWSNIGQGGDPSVVRIVLIGVPINAAASSSKGVMMSSAQ